ncbi:MAG: hypothetical protein KF884_04090 [Fimbriimonadaceae bacterium]|nr:hypothetical protein [Fimbriimonadaceae bacterium]QYK59270.1 MAG: hypothetical protein KF884_04090 [Fimbriimonadaceae bacterium]
MRPILNLLALAVFLSASQPAPAQTMRGKGQFPQFRNLSGLPGGGFAVSPEGSPDVKGALSLSTPIAYSLTDYRIVFQYASQSNDRRFRFDSPRQEGIRGTNATGAAMIGLPLEDWRVTLTGMFLSSDLDSVLNVHVQPPLGSDDWAVAFGAQDFFSTGGAAGTNHPNDRDLSRSLYAVGTYRFAEGIYVSGGLGTERFKRGFIGASAPLGDSARVSLEQDGYGFNGYALYEIKALERVGGTKRDARVLLGVGLVKMKHPVWSVGLSF